MVKLVSTSKSCFSVLNPKLIKLFFPNISSNGFIYSQLPHLPLTRLERMHLCCPPPPVKVRRKVYRSPFSCADWWRADGLTDWLRLSLLGGDYRGGDCSAEGSYIPLVRIRNQQVIWFTLFIEPVSSSSSYYVTWYKTTRHTNTIPTSDE